MLHTMAMLQTYQADLKDMSVGGSIDEESFSELRRVTDLSLGTTEQMAMHSVLKTAVRHGERYL